MLRMPPQASSAVAMRHRRNGWVVTGTSEATWAQYSNSSRGAVFDARSSKETGYGPSRL